MADLGRSFWRLWSVFTASNLADGLTLVAFPLLAVSLTDDARLVALVATFRLLPFVVVGLPAGVLLDRIDRRRAVAWAQVVTASSAAVLAIAVITNNESIALLFVISFTVGLGEVITDSGLPAMVRTVVRSEQLEVANSRISATQTVSNVFVGPPVGALAFQVDPALALSAPAVMYLVASGLLARATGDFRPAPSAPAESRRLELTAGLRYVWGHSVLRPLALTVAVFAFVGEANWAIFVVLATEQFGFSEVEYGLLLALDGLASVVMSFFVARVVRRTSHATSMRIRVVAFSASALLFGFGTVAAAAIVGVLLSGVADPSWNIVSATVRQRLVPDHIFGRTMTAYLVIAWGIQPFGAALGGVVAEAWGPQWVFVASAVVVGSLLAFAQPMFRELDRAMLAARHVDPE